MLIPHLGAQDRESLGHSMTEGWASISLTRIGRTLKVLYGGECADHHSAFSSWRYDEGLLFSVNRGRFVNLGNRIKADQEWQCRVWIKGIPPTLLTKVGGNRNKWVVLGVSSIAALMEVSEKKWTKLEQLKKAVEERGEGTTT